MATAKKVQDSKSVALFHMPGDKVVWRGIKLTVVRVKENGDIEAHSPTMFVTVSSHDQLERWSGKDVQ